MSPAIGMSGYKFMGQAHTNAYRQAGGAIGYEHTFANQAADLLTAVAEGRPMQPDFDDGLKCQSVLDAVLEAAASDRWVDVKKPS
jgi:predicted dehydrogenase